MNPNTEGVTWPHGKTRMHQRTTFDMVAAKQFNPGAHLHNSHSYESYHTTNPFWNRTSFDKRMLKKYDPARESYQNTRPPAGYATIYDDPYQTWSYKVIG